MYVTIFSSYYVLLMIQYCNHDELYKKLKTTPKLIVTVVQLWNQDENIFMCNKSSWQARQQESAKEALERAKVERDLESLQRRALVKVVRDTKGGKGYGKGVVRHSGAGRAADNAIQGVTKPAILRLARRGGVKRIASGIYDETRKVLKFFWNKSFVTPLRTQNTQTERL